MWYALTPSAHLTQATFPRGRRFRARYRCVVCARLSLKGETASERTQAFISSKKMIKGITYLVYGYFAKLPATCYSRFAALPEEVWL